MKVYRLSRGRTLGTFNFGAYQVYVAELEGLKGEHKKGIVTLYAGDFDVETPHPLEEVEANQIAALMEGICPETLPVAITIPGCRVNYWTSVTFTLKKCSADSRGRFYSGSSRGFQPFNIGWNTVTIYESSLRACAAALRKLYAN